MLKNSEAIDKIRSKLEKMDEVDFANLKAGLVAIGTSSDQAEDLVEQLRAELGKVEDEADGIKRSAQEMENLKNSMLNFFSVSNSI
jgi:archaellum component FlaC